MKPNDTARGELVPRQLKLAEFNRWLQRVTDADPSVAVSNTSITVVP